MSIRFRVKIAETHIAHSYRLFYLLKNRIDLHPM